MPKKPKKCGFRIFVRARVSGIVYNLLMYAALKTFDNATFSEQEEELFSGDKAVVHLCNTIQYPERSTVYFDN